jgi:hypothetical protein
LRLLWTCHSEAIYLGAWTDWLGTCCWFCLEVGGELISPTVTGQACATGDGWGCCCVLLRSADAKAGPGVVWSKRTPFPM